MFGPHLFLRLFVTIRNTFAAGTQIHGRNIAHEAASHVAGPCNKEQCAQMVVHVSVRVAKMGRWPAKAPGLLSPK